MNHTSVLAEKRSFKVIVLKKASNRHYKKVALEAKYFDSALHK